MSIVVVGDFMLDVLMDSMSIPKFIAGGAGTVVRASRNLCKQVNSVGWLFNSFVGRKISRLLDEEDGELFISNREDGCERIRLHILSKKHHKMLFRWDRVGQNFNASVVENRILQAIGSGDVNKILVISDFGKAGANVDIRSHHDLTYRLALVGSKSSLYPSLPRSVLITSTVDRALSPATIADLLKEAKQLANLRSGPVILTGNSLGAAYVSAQEEYYVCAKYVHNIFDVGAGDWLLGSMAGMINEGSNVRHALAYAVDMATESVSEHWIGSK